MSFQSPIEKLIVSCPQNSLSPSQPQFHLHLTMHLFSPFVSIVSLPNFHTHPNQVKIWVPNYSPFIILVIRRPHTSLPSYSLPHAPIPTPKRVVFLNYISPTSNKTESPPPLFLSDKSTSLNYKIQQNLHSSNLSPTQKSFMTAPIIYFTRR